MTIINNTEARPLDFAAAPFRFFGMATSNARRVWRNRKTVADLANLDDRALRDIGLTRADVRSALAVPAGGDPSRQLASLVAERRFAG